MRRPTVSRFRFSDQPQPFERNARKIDWLNRNGDAMDRRCMRDNHFYIAEISTNRDRTRAFTRSVSAERDQPFSVQVSNSNLAQLCLQRLQAEGLGPSGTLANFLHIGEMEIDEMSEGGRIGVTRTARRFAAIDSALVIESPFLGVLSPPEGLTDVPALAAHLDAPIAGRKTDKGGQRVRSVCGKPSNQGVSGRN